MAVTGPTKFGKSGAALAPMTGRGSVRKQIKIVLLIDGRSAEDRRDHLSPARALEPGDSVWLNLLARIVKSVRSTLPWRRWRAATRDSLKAVLLCNWLGTTSSASRLNSLEVATPTR